MTTAIKRDLLDDTEQTLAVEPPLKRFWGLLVGLLVALLVGYALWVSPASEQEAGQAQTSQTGGTNDGLSTAVLTLPGRDRAIPEAGLAMPQVWWQSPTAQAKANKTLIRRMYAEMATEGSLAGVDRLFSADFRHHEPGAVTEAVDLATFLEQLKRQQATFYELRYTIEDIVAEGDQVVVRWTAGGTPLKTFETDPPTGQPAVWRGVTIWRVVEGEIVAGWTVSEALADYQARLSDGHVGRSASRDFPVTDELPDQIPDRQALAAYQARLSDLLSSRPTEKLKTDKLSK